MRLSRRSLEQRAAQAREILLNCGLCPRGCGVDRTRGELGFCKAGALSVSSYSAHHGEEPPLSGQAGSGTIFFTHCTMRCVYCQNYPISQLGVGDEVSVKELAGMMLKLEKRGCHNINLVTPTHYVPQILEALLIAADAGLSVPLVYNTSGYESSETLAMLDGVIDIYLPDMRYASVEAARAYSQARDYPEVNRVAVKEMHAQVGDLTLDKRGVAQSGLLIRHLVLPGDLSGTPEIMDFIAREVSQNTYISLMDQYFPAHKAVGIPPLDRRITKAEYYKAIEIMNTAGLSNGWVQYHD